MRQKALDDWVNTNEKFALVGIHLPIDDGLNATCLPGDFQAIPRPFFKLPKRWEGWLGSIRAEEVRKYSLCILKRSASVTPSILDGESNALQYQLQLWYYGLLLAGKIPEYSDPILVIGGRPDSKTDIRRISTLDRSASTIVDDHSPISLEILFRAANISLRLQALNKPSGVGYWRLFRCLHLFRMARANNDVLDRIHQFARCIEGLIDPAQGKTKQQFKHRTELFVGPSQHDFMGRLYEVRSDIEHLHENKHLEQFDRASRIELAILESASELVARTSLERIILSPTLAANFANEASLASFWAKRPDERRAVWGHFIDPLAGAKGFDFDNVDDESLGRR